MSRNLWFLLHSKHFPNFHWTAEGHRKDLRSQTDTLVYWRLPLRCDIASFCAVTDDFSRNVKSKISRSDYAISGWREICHVQWDTINHKSSLWHDDPINFRIASRQCFTNVAREFMGRKKSHLSSCFRVTFSQQNSTTAMLSRNLLLETFAYLPLDSMPSKWCVYLFFSSSLGWRSFKRLDLSRWRLRFHFRYGPHKTSTLFLLHLPRTDLFR